MCQRNFPLIHLTLTELTQVSAALTYKRFLILSPRIVSLFDTIVSSNPQRSNSSSNKSIVIFVVGLEHLHPSDHDDIIRAVYWLSKISMQSRLRWIHLRPRLYLKCGRLCCHSASYTLFYQSLNSFAYIGPIHVTLHETFHPGNPRMSKMESFQYSVL